MTDTIDDRAESGDLDGVVRQAMAEVLGITQVGSHDDFFELGGQSLLAGRLVAKIRQLTGTRVSVMGFLEEPTAAGLVELVRRTNATSVA